MNETTLKGLLAAACAAAGAYFHALALPLALLAAVMVLDYVSGMTRAWIAHEFSSRTGLRGIVKKLAYLFGVSVAVVADWVVQLAAEQAGFSLGGRFFLALLVTVWLILNECISILENVAAIGAPLPPFLHKAIEHLRHSAEKKGASTHDQQPEP